jgi:hypothetical protein
MKRLMVLAAVAATSTVASAFDYKINLESRVDFVDGSQKTTSTATVPLTATEKFANFSNNVIRMNMVGAINENLSYRFRYRFLASSPNLVSGTTRETATTGAVDYIYVDHKNSMFTTRLGKQNWVEYAGRESFAAASDVFATSDAVTNFKAASGSDYRFGATAMFKFMETNTLNIAISNPNNTLTDTVAAVNTSDANPARENSGIAYGAYYTGSFLNKMVQPVLAYTALEQDGDNDVLVDTSKTKKVTNTMMAYGLRSEVAGAVIDADYKEFKQPARNSGTNTTAGNNEMSTKSMNISVAYPVGEFTPMVAYINDKYTRTNIASVASVDYKKDSFVIGAFWKPFADMNFRYHVLYTSAVTKYDRVATVGTDIKNANSKVDFSQITLGFKIDI